MPWIAEWFDTGRKLVIDADSLNDADDRAYRIVGKYPNCIYWGKGDE